MKGPHITQKVRWKGGVVKNLIWVQNVDSIALLNWLKDRKKKTKLS